MNTRTLKLLEENLCKRVLCKWHRTGVRDLVIKELSPTKELVHFIAGDGDYWMQLDDLTYFKILDVIGDKK